MFLLALDACVFLYTRVTESSSVAFMLANSSLKLTTPIIIVDKMTIWDNSVSDYESTTFLGDDTEESLL